ncbi:hypothetical protein GEO21_16200 [Sphingobacterium faecium]|uniref:nuclear transport factor 2 family protein n=1 Tax=Sphingobacterium faecium TaxID=34087 RepID=UPI0012927F58|nr:nuclear transport factor 2 family protein [Sphingobacterium faecium]MQP29043.1 hypothetical protein [Sphingobacterium faecium]
MKTLVKTFAAAALIAIGTFSMAAGKPDKKIINLSSATYALDHYVDIITEGQSIGVEQLFAADFTQKSQGASLRTNNRTAMIDFFKKQKGEKLNCKTSTQILESKTNYVIATVTMQFDGFTKSDLVTLINESGVWKVTSSVTSYK